MSPWRALLPHRSAFVHVSGEQGSGDRVFVGCERRVLPGGTRLVLRRRAPTLGRSRRHRLPGHDLPAGHGDHGAVLSTYRDLVLTPRRENAKDIGERGPTAGSTLAGQEPPYDDPLPDETGVQRHRPPISSGPGFRFGGVGVDTSWRDALASVVDHDRGGPR